jgi:DNA polymerase III gamma/tau subunit
MTVDSLMQIGVDPRIVLAEVSEVFRNVMIFFACGTDSTLLEVMPEEKAILEDLSKKIPMKTVMRVGKSISSIEKELSLNVNERFVLEAALIQGLLHIRDDLAALPATATPVAPAPATT